MTTNTLYLANEEATVSFGASLAKITQGKGIITLSGDLGAGKTTLSRGLVKAFGYTGAVKSPTYTIVEPYEFENNRVMHFDLYRLEDPEELEYLGFRDYLDENTLCIIEWPEKSKNYLPAIDLQLSLSYSDNHGRKISWQANTKHGEEMSLKLNQLQAI